MQMKKNVTLTTFITPHTQYLYANATNDEDFS
jgi:hypothetical protein